MLFSGQNFLNKKSQRKRVKAFSLIEVSVVILIIGIFVAGIAVGNSMITKSRLQMAEALTRSSPIVGIRENVLWLETSLGGSIDDSQMKDGAAISSWSDQNNSGVKVAVTAVGVGPVYANTINRVHAVKFSGSATDYLQISDASFLNNTDYTIVVLEKRQSNATNNYFIGENPSGTANQTLTLGYSSDANVIHSQGSGTSYNSLVSAYSNSIDKPRLFVFTHSAVDGNKTYVNGLLAGEDATKTAHLTGLTTLAIGKGYVGEIGEIAVFTKALNNEARVAVEDYLSKKWSRPSLLKSTSDGKCVSGIVTDKGCSMDCSTSSIVGVSSPSTITDGASGVSATCGATGYAGTITLGCSLGNISKSADCACDTANGYSLSGGACVKQCSVSVNGSTTTTVAFGVTQVACNAGGNYSTTPFTFAACDGTARSGSCSCVTGYTGSTCSTCDTANGYQMDGGVCKQGCVVPAGSGTTKTFVLAGSTSTPCDSSGYSGTLQYTCGSSGNFNVTTACNPPLCTVVTGPVAVTADTTTVASDVIYKFTTVGTYRFNCPSSVTARVLVVGGGGGGGNNAAGGGGGGGYLYASSFVMPSGDSDVIVGAGGAGSTTAYYSGSTGEQSGFANLLFADGGGGGGGNAQSLASEANGKVGGSGGGGSFRDGIGGTATQGNKGGNGLMSNPYPSAGGGGAGSQGNNGSGSQSGAGGEGISNSISGASVIYASGGGGGATTQGAIAGLGGTNGGKGATSSTNAVNGVSATGSGGGGGSNITGRINGGNGGSGIVIIRYTK